MAAALLYVYYERDNSELVRESESKVRGLSFAIDRELAGVETVLLAMASSPNLLAGNLPAFDRQARDVVRDERISNILLADLSGQQLVNTRTPVGAALPLHGNPELVKSVINTQKPVISGLFIGKVLNQPLVIVGVPVMRDSKVLYVLSASILPSRLGQIFMQQQVDPEEVVGLLDGLGAVIVRSQEAEVNIALGASRQVMDKLKISDRGTMKYLTADGSEALFVYNRSPRTGWTSYTILTDELMHRSLWKTLGLLIGVTLVSLAAALGMSWVIGGRITRTIRALGQPALALGEGKPLVVPSLPIREVDDVGRAMVNASQMLGAAHTAQRRSEARMRAILDSAMDAIITVDDQQIIMLFNRAAVKMFGCPAEQAIGQSINRFIPSRFHARYAHYVDRQRSHAGGVHDISMGTGLRNGNEEFPVEASYSNVMESGTVLHTVIIRDVSARERAYQALERSNVDLQQFAYIASHDLKTPLRSISGFVQVLAQNYAQQLDEKAVSLIQRTSDAARRLEQLTDDLLLYARISAESKPFELVKCAEVVQEVLQLLDAAISQSGGKVVVGELPSVLGDHTKLVQLFLNLIGNGLKYCKDRAPLINVSAATNERETVFSVSDNGIGIDAKHHDRIFEVFKRLHTQKEYSGTGIGLSVCRRVVDHHGGIIWVNSVVGVGSTFSFSIPHSPAGSDVS